MADKNCAACADLQEYAPDFVANGVTDEVCASLKNNTGLGTNADHNDCDDLQDANDCLIGNMTDQVDAFDDCDWKGFQKSFIPNVWTMLKAMNCADCGKQAKIEDMCTLLDAIIAPPVTPYGIRPLATSPELVRCGTIPNKNGKPIMERKPEDTVNQATKTTQNVGIYYAKQTVNSCSDGKCKTYEWISPSIFEYKFSEDVEYNDILWYCDKATLQSLTGMTDKLWHAFTVSNWTWTNYGISQSHKYAWLRLTIEEDRMGPDYMTLEYRGSSYPSGSPGNSEVVMPADSHRLYVYNC